MNKVNYYSEKFSSAVGTKNTWNAIRDIGIGKNYTTPICPIDANELNRMFTNFPTNTIPVTGEHYISENNNISFDQSAFEFSCVNQSDVYHSFSLIKSNAVGFDKINPKFIRIILPLILPFVTYLFNSIITTSIYPTKWKYAKIIPIPKSNTDYRPIAILSYLSKVFEKMLSIQMGTYFHKNHLITENQSGFRLGHSCITALINVSENIRQELDEGKINFLVLLDHSKAFDTVNHQILCMKLKHFFNFSFTSTKLISSYLSDRTQSVCVNNLTSEPVTLARGVPQGSILGPILFSIYINDLPQHLSHCKMHMYADDVQVYISSPITSIQENVEKLNVELTKIHHWATANGLCLNPQKSKCLIIHKKSSQPIPRCEVKIDNQNIEIVSKAKNLGITFNNNMTWSSHIDTLLVQIYVKLKTLWVTQYFTPVRVRMLLAKAYLVPGLLYGCELFGKCDSISKRKLTVLYNNIIRYVYGLKRRDSISFFSKSLYGVSFENLINIRILVCLHKIINTREPGYLYNLLKFSRSRRGRRLIVPMRRCLLSEWQFFVNATRLWNKIPHYIQLISNATQFRKVLFNFFC